MNRTVQILRIEMEGRWFAAELGAALSSFSDLYDLRFVLELMREDQTDWEQFYDELLHFPPFRWQWKRKFMRQQRLFSPYLPLSSLQFDVAQLSCLREYLEPDEMLEIRRVNYASPGATDLAGIGAIVGHIKDFVIKLIERSDTQRQRELNDERAAIELERMRIENARNFVALGRELGFTEVEMRKLVAHVDDKQNILVRLIDQKKITGATDGGGNQ